MLLKIVSATPRMGATIQARRFFSFLAYILLLACILHFPKVEMVLTYPRFLGGMDAKARVHRGSWRSSCVAPGGAGAAAIGAGDRIAQQFVARKDEQFKVEPISCSLSRRSVRNRLHRRPERGDRVSLGGGTLRSTAGLGCGIGSTSSEGDRCSKRWLSVGVGRQSGDNYYSDCFHDPPPTRSSLGWSQASAIQGGTSPA